jgi:hypothetical protein
MHGLHSGGTRQLVGEVDMDHLILWHDVLSYNKSCIQWHAIWIVRIVVALQRCIKIVLRALATCNEITDQFLNGGWIQLLLHQLVPCRLDTSLNTMQHQGQRVLVLVWTALGLT